LASGGLDHLVDECISSKVIICIHKVAQRTSIYTLYVTLLWLAGWLCKESSCQRWSGEDEVSRFGSWSHKVVSRGVNCSCTIHNFVTSLMSIS
jgi:hypothetical protein